MGRLTEPDLIPEAAAEEIISEPQTLSVRPPQRRGENAQYDTQLIWSTVDLLVVFSIRRLPSIPQSAAMKIRIEIKRLRRQVNHAEKAAKTLGVRGYTAFHARRKIRALRHKRRALGRVSK